MKSTMTKGNRGFFVFLFLFLTSLLFFFNSSIKATGAQDLLKSKVCGDISAACSGNPQKALNQQQQFLLLCDFLNKPFGFLKESRQIQQEILGQHFLISLFTQFASEVITDSGKVALINLFSHPASSANFREIEKRQALIRKFSELGDEKRERLEAIIREFKEIESAFVKMMLEAEKKLKDSWGDSLKKPRLIMYGAALSSYVIMNSLFYYFSKDSSDSNYVSALVPTGTEAAISFSVSGVCEFGSWIWNKAFGADTQEQRYYSYFAESATQAAIVGVVGGNRLRNNWSLGRIVFDPVKGVCSTTYNWWQGRTQVRTLVQILDDLVSVLNEIFSEEERCDLGIATLIDVCQKVSGERTISSRSVENIRAILGNIGLLDTCFVVAKKIRGKEDSCSSEDDSYSFVKFDENSHDPQISFGDHNHKFCRSLVRDGNKIEIQHPAPEFVMNLLLAHTFGVVQEFGNATMTLFNLACMRLKASSTIVPGEKTQITIKSMELTTGVS